MDKVSAVKLKRGLSKIKKKLTAQIGAVWKLPKNEIVKKIKNLNYSYDEKTDTLKASKSSAMIRKPRNISLIK